jgi:hypothetical protein
LNFLSEKKTTVHFLFKNSKSFSKLLFFLNFHLETMDFDLTAMIALTINAKMPLTIIKESMAALSPEL